MKNYIPKDQLLKKYEEQKIQKVNKNNRNNTNLNRQTNNNNNNNNLSSPSVEESKGNSQNYVEEKQMEVIYEM